jgi:hypothetical protein
LCAHHDDGEHGHHQGALQDQYQRGRKVREGVSAPDAEDVQDDEDDGLDGDPAEDVADGDAEVVRECSTGGDGDLGQVGDDGQEDQAAQGLAQAQARREHVGGIGQFHAGDPHCGRRSGEDQHKVGKDSESNTLLLFSVA